MSLKIIKNKNKNEERKFKSLTVQITFTKREDLRLFITNWAVNQTEELVPYEEYMKLMQMTL